MEKRARPCVGRHPKPLETAHECRLCELVTTNLKYAEFWGERTEQQRIKLSEMLRVLRSPCVYKGVKLPNQPCGSELFTCNFDGSVCAIIKECSAAKRVCKTCEHYEPG